MMRNITEIQRRLIDLGYLPALDDKGERNDDGRFGQRSLDAYNHFRATVGKGPVVQASMAELNFDLFPTEREPEPPPRSNPISDFFTRFAVNAAISKLKGLPAMSFLTGYKTYATAIVIAVMGVYSLLFGELPLVGMSVDPGSAIMALLSALGLGFARIGAKTEAKKAVGE